MKTEDKKPVNTPTSNTRKDFRIKTQDRVFIAGKTGSGKTVLAQHLLMTARRLIVIDGKDGISNDAWNLRAYEKGDIRKVSNPEETFRIRLINDMQVIMDLTNVAYDTGNTIIYIDEVTVTIPPRSAAPQIFLDIWTRGRSRNVGGWANTQRPTQIPLFFLSEAEHLFTFRLNLEADRKRIYEFVGNKKILTPTVDKFGFYYYNGEQLRYYQQLKI